MKQEQIIKTLREYTQKNPINILVGIPCYGSMVFSTFTNSLLQLQDLLTKCNIQVQYYFLGGESLIPRARNNIISYFNHHRQFTHLLF